MTQQKEINKFRDELLKHWDVSSDKLLAILEKKFKKLPGSHYEQAEILHLFLQYFESSEFNVEQNDKPGTTSKDVKMDSVNSTEDNLNAVKYQFVKEWLLKKYISAKGEFFLSLFIAKVKINNWIDLEYEIKYLQMQIEIIEDHLGKESATGNNTAFDINQKFIMGQYPDVFTTDPNSISFVEASIAFRKFLKAQLAEKQPSSSQEQLSIQGEIKGEKDSLGNLKVTIPLRQIEQSLKEALEKESKDTQKPHQKNEINLYTLKETAKMLGVSLQTLNDWTNKGIIKKYRIGNKQIRIKREDIEKAIKKVEVYSFNPNHN